MLDAIRKRAPVAHDERRTPRIRSQYIGQPSLCIDIVHLVLSDVIRFAGHDRETGAMRGGVAVTPLVSETPRIGSSVADRVIDLSQQLFANTSLSNCEPSGISRHFKSAQQLKMCKTAYIIEVECVGVARSVDVRDVV